MSKRKSTIDSLFKTKLRRRLWLWAAALGLGAAVPSIQSLARRPAKVQPALTMRLTILDCHDGDTCKAKNTDGLTMKLRLVGIDAPEVASTRGPKKKRGPGQVYGKEAKAFLEKQVVGKSFDVRVYGNDVYNRYLALIEDPAVKNTSHSINEELIEQGYAFAYDDKGRGDAEISKWAIAAQTRARNAKIGLWGLAQQPEDPKLYRQQHR